MGINEINKYYMDRRSSIQDSSNTIEKKKQLMDKEFEEYCKKIEQWSKEHANE